LGSLEQELVTTDASRKALAVNQALLALGNERFEADGATFIRNRSVPAIRDANHVAHVTAATPDEIDRLLARVEREFAGFPHRRFDLDFTTAPAFEARLALEGYERADALVMLLDGELAGDAHPCDIRPVTDAAAWEAYAALHDIDWQAYVQRVGNPEDTRTGRAMASSRRAKSPPANYWLACVDGEPRAYCSSWGGIDGVGQVEDLFTHPDFRRRGLARALIHRCVADCREHGAGAVVIVADPADTPKQMYAAMGFRPVAIKREYWKNVEGQAVQPSETGRREKG
jgi:GNAT superfamily N-acetyltransferase